MIDKIVRINSNKVMIVFHDKPAFIIETDTNDALDFALWILYSNNTGITKVSEFKQVINTSIEDTQWLKVA